MSEKLNISDAARYAKCDEKQIRRAITKGGLVKDDQGLIDSAQLDAPWRKANSRTVSRSSDTSDNGAVIRTDVREVVRGVSDTSARAELDVAAAEGFVQRVLNGEYESQFEADRIKANALAVKHVLDAREKAGAMMDIADAEQVLFEMARNTREAWLNWPARVAPLIAAGLGIETDALVPLFSEHVHQQLDDLGEPAGGFGQVA